MSLRQSLLTKRYSNIFYLNHAYGHMVHGIPVHGTHVHIHMYLRIHAWCIWATVCQSQHEVKTITVCQSFIMNSDERKPDFAEEESVALLKALSRGRRD